MATYLRPGVFVEETLQPLNDPASDSGESVAAFVGTSSKGGPIGPTLVSSWSHYQSLFGSIKTSKDDLAYGVYSFFNNGGSQAYVVRAVNASATSASVTLKDDAGSPVDVLKATALSAGTWAADPAHGVFLTVVPGDGERFTLVVEVGSGLNRVAREQFVDLSVDPSDNRFAIAVVNSPAVGSKFVRLALVGTPTTAPAASSGVPLVGGADGTGSPDLAAAVARLDDVDSNLTLNLPGVTDTTVLTDVIEWADGRGNVFVVVDVPQPGAGDSAADVAADAQTFISSLPPSSNAAVYGPWLYVTDPASSVPGALVEIAPGGSVVGQYARTDVTRGVAKAPAGTGTALKSVNQTSVRFTDTQLDALNQSQVNVIRNVPGAGFCIMGARTLSKGMPDRYINIRRTLKSLTRGLTNLTRFAVFEPNDEDLWETIEAVLDQYLTTQFQIGTLRGSTPEEAFFVKCDEELNDAAAVNAGIVKVEVGVALSSPAEFIVIRIGQFDGGVTVEDVA